MAGPGICAWRIPAHLRCTQYPILLHHMDICFLTCICSLQISQIQTRLFNLVGPGLVSTSPAFVRSSASHPAGLHGRLVPPKYIHHLGHCFTTYTDQLVFYIHWILDFKYTLLFNITYSLHTLVSWVLYLPSGALGRLIQRDADRYRLRKLIFEHRRCHMICQIRDEQRFSTSDYKQVKIEYSTWTKYLVEYQSDHSLL